jgi:ribosome-associated toxin RatA of RatAB toxin-antitoxin module
LVLKAPPLEALASGTGPMLRLLVNDDGSPYGTVGAMEVAAPPDRIWSLIRDVSSWSDRVPMIHRVRQGEDTVDITLRFRIALFSTKFTIKTTIVDEEDAYELRYLSGSPKNLSLRFAVDDLGDGKSKITAGVTYDIYSLGWLVKVFLRHHPEIQLGVFPGTVLTVLDSLRIAAEGKG